MCYDWTACRIALADRWGDDAGVDLDFRCRRGVGGIVALVVTLVVCAGCCCFGGYCVGKHSLRRWKRTKEERAGLTGNDGAAAAAVADEGMASGGGINLASSAEGGDPLVRIERLKQLLDSGAVTKDEFAEGKAKMMARL